MSLDSNNVTESSTAMARRLRVCNGEIEDKISGLPDSVIDHILSFLPTKIVVATSLLSKHWKQFWRSQHSLYFDDASFPDAFAFCQFLKSIMVRRDKTLPILSFHLICRRYTLSDNDFEYFAIGANFNGVENVIIDFCLPTTLPPTLSLKELRSLTTTLPPLFLTSTTLSVLKLKKVNLSMIRRIHLPSLKVLHLESVIFIMYEYLKSLIYGCPILQELEINDLRVNITYMMIPRPMPCIPSLIRANISYYSMFDVPRDVWHYPIPFEWLYNVEHLRLQLNSSPPTISSVFLNLTHLDLIFNFDHERPLTVSKWCWLRKMLQNTPNLQTLIIHNLFSVEARVLHHFNRWEWDDPKIVPKCLLSHLTTTCLLGDCELPFAKYIMQNSRLLSTMTIQSPKDTNTKLQMEEDLSSCPRISPACNLLFI
ncbi:FBD-associated F-box protein At4g10400-like [Vicia villosa]|uniref:FBD-associated F-box protein At4g10400-like n=1 Tax=Vicia villosa TaxID=3911 RepID=UPI00273AF176|nr:FBD-associated F-box protein At4g10400-like [Vicia villosa]